MRGALPAFAVFDTIPAVPQRPSEARLRLDRVRPIIAFCLLAAAAGAACFGGSSNSNAPDSSRIPTATLPAKLPDPKILGNSAVSAAGGSSYVIKDGDTLAGIASRLGIALDDLRTANPGVDPGTLRVGQSIKLPANPDTPPPAAATATPPKGSATVSAATATSEPPPTEPPPTEAPASPIAPGATVTPASVGQSYTVQDGDYPAKIAAMFGITVEELLAANPGIDPTHMHIGDVIIIPPKRP
jgi:peptidoglycan DL-endopeptidase LytF